MKTELLKEDLVKYGRVLGTDVEDLNKIVDDMIANGFATGRDKVNGVFHYPFSTRMTIGPAMGFNRGEEFLEDARDAGRVKSCLVTIEVLVFYDMEQKEMWDKIGVYVN